MPSRGFDFDVWVALGQSDPDEFERQRVAMVERACAAMGGIDQPHVSGLLCRIELERRRTNSAMELSIRLYDLMWERLVELDSILTVRRFLGIEPVNRKSRTVIELRQ